ncbi:MAG: hypothetical protein LBS98_05325 [Coriobacteriales bacterium]|jgi:hypothetical protein|nr:hypothetical protein [Coriobacteriales bacterium]
MSAESFEAELPPMVETVTLPAVDAVLFGTADAQRILGGAGTGKTELLIRRILELLETDGLSDVGGLVAADGLVETDEGQVEVTGSGTQASPEILVLCASPVSADAFGARLTAALGSTTVGSTILSRVTERVRITTPRALALELLALDAARTFTGRPPRLLAGFEVNFLLEDMKTSGIRPRRLREILKFFYRGWTELAEDDPEWLFMVEERQLHGMLLENLRIMQGMLEPELAKLALGFLRDDSTVLEELQWTHVLVDDFGYLSRASQLLPQLLAARSITIAADPHTTHEVFESHPYLGGIDEFITINPDAQTQTLHTTFRSEAVTAAQNALFADAPNSSRCDAPGKVELREFQTPAEEFEGIAVEVECLINSEGLRPADIGIVALHRIWGRQVAAQLEKHGIRTDGLFEASSINGDIREHERSITARIYTALRLVADPQDAASWRCWCGFGDYLANSALFMELKTRIRNPTDRDTGLVGILDALANTTAQPPTSSAAPLPPAIEKVATAYREGISLIDSCKGLCGKALLKQLSALVCKTDSPTLPPALWALLGDVSAQTPADLVAYAEGQLFFPRFLGGENCVRILTPPDLCGLSFKTLIVCGTVNGFLPSRDYFDGAVTPLDKQQKMRIRDRQQFTLLVGAATENLLFTWFRKTDLESAERLKLKIARIHLEKGERICLMTPSELLGSIGLI